MNTNQKIILITMVLVISGMFLYPPFNLVAKNGTVLNMGYAWIFEPPRRGYFVSNVNTAMLLIQWIGVIVVGGLIFVLAKSPSKDSESPSIAVDFEQRGNERQKKGPYPWKTVLLWTIVVFIAGFFGARPPQGVEREAALAFKFLVALVYAIVGGTIIGIVKFFWRPKSNQIDLSLSSIEDQKKHSESSTKMVDCALCGRKTPEDDLQKYMDTNVCPECYVLKNAH
jgi:hypothetical protein